MVLFDPSENGNVLIQADSRIYRLDAIYK
jgi:hypothetical protein